MMLSDRCSVSDLLVIADKIQLYSIIKTSGGGKFVSILFVRPKFFLA